MNRGLILAGAIVIAANTFALAHVAYNRSRVVQRVELSEFELPLQHQSEDNSGISLRLDTIIRGATVSPVDDWPGAAKLQQSGFDLSSRREQLAREVFVVFELGGEVWRKYTDESVQRNPRLLQYGPHTRLIPVDVARDPETLLRAYPDRAQYLVMKAFMNMYAYNQVRSGRVVPVPGGVHVPLPFSEVLRSMAKMPRVDNARYSVTLCLGRDDEPWIENVKIAAQ